MWARSSESVMEELEKINTQILLEEDYERSTWEIRSGGEEFIGYLEETETGYDAGVLPEKTSQHYDLDPRFFSGETTALEAESAEDAFYEIIDDSYESLESDEGLPEIKAI